MIIINKLTILKKVNLSVVQHISGCRRCCCCGIITLLNLIKGYNQPFGTAWWVSRKVTVPACYYQSEHEHCDITFPRKRLWIPLRYPTINIGRTPTNGSDTDNTLMYEA